MKRILSALTLAVCLLQAQDTRPPAARRPRRPPCCWPCVSSRLKSRRIAGSSSASCSPSQNRDATRRRYPGTAPRRPRIHEERRRHLVGHRRSRRSRRRAGNLIFVVDGVPTMDPRNPAVSESNTNSWSLVYVPGAEFMDTAVNVPHGAVASITYYSTALSRFRDMHIYTPPGYELGGGKFPVFYLLHGSGDCDDSWTSVGRAGFILDSIAAKKAQPMIVVMPAGHTSTTFPLPGAARPTRDEFADDFMDGIMPYVEKHYRGALTDRAHTAMAGLSMGGGQTLARPT